MRVAVTLLLRTRAAEWMERSIVRAWQACGPAEVVEAARSGHRDTGVVGEAYPRCWRLAGPSSVVGPGMVYCGGSRARELHACGEQLRVVGAFGQRAARRFCLRRVSGASGAVAAGVEVDGARAYRRRHVARYVSSSLQFTRRALLVECTELPARGLDARRARAAGEELERHLARSSVGDRRVGAIELVER
ncbi:hypothetical protein B0H10DRAFT_1953729 [Mycena sp. CBHHK59/15]|nr:hypothetical protein B0H10DRAFT_1953729 [Mycena sp. CBHHK59/15]